MITSSSRNMCFVKLSGIWLYWQSSFYKCSTKFTSYIIKVVTTMDKIGGVQATVSWILSRALGAENVSIVAEEDIEALSNIVCKFGCPFQCPAVSNHNMKNCMNKQF